MLGLFKSYDDEYLELYEYLTQDWHMKAEYAKPFLNEYKKSVGKLLAEGKQRMSQLENSNDPELRLLRFANLGAEYSGALVAQAYYAFMGDLRRGKHVGTSIEKTIWAILCNRSDLLGNIDKAMEMWIDDKTDEKFPGLFEEVFADSSDNTDEAKLLGVDQLDKTNSQDQMTNLVQKNRVPMDDENLYLIATNEVDSGQQDEALWAKAIALCQGDNGKAKYKYIALRVEILADENSSTEKDIGADLKDLGQDIKIISSAEDTHASKNDEQTIPNTNSGTTPSDHAQVDQNKPSGRREKIAFSLVLLFVGVVVAAIIKEKFGSGQYIAIAISIFIILGIWSSSSSAK